jgi:hypothetical protein
MIIRKQTLRKLIYTQVVIAFIAFWAGFLQDTKFEFVIYLLYFFMFVVGAKLVLMSIKSRSTLTLKGFLLATGLSSSIYFLFFLVALLSQLLYGIGITEVMKFLEDILYLVSLIYITAVIGSIILLRKN